MLIERVSPLSGNLNKLEISVTMEQLNDWYGGTLIQKAMPNLTADEREFIKTGITAQEWDETFSEEEE
jgi:hypothetical protein